MWVAKLPDPPRLANAAPARKTWTTIATTNRAATAACRRSRTTGHLHPSRTGATGEDRRRLRSSQPSAVPPIMRTRPAASRRPRDSQLTIRSFLLRDPRRRWLDAAPPAQEPREPGPGPDIPVRARRHRQPRRDVGRTIQLGARLALVEGRGAGRPDPLVPEPSRWLRDLGSASRPDGRRHRARDPGRRRLRDPARP